MLKINDIESYYNILNIIKQLEDLEFIVETSRQHGVQIRHADKRIDDAVKHFKFWNANQVIDFIRGYKLGIEAGIRQKSDVIC